MASLDFVIRPLKKPSSIVMVASTAMALVDLVRALAGIYTYALYRHTVDCLSKRSDVGATGYVGQQAAFGMGASAGSELALLGGGIAGGTANGIYTVEAKDDRDGFLIGFAFGFVGGAGGAMRLGSQGYQNYQAWSASFETVGGPWFLPGP